MTEDATYCFLVNGASNAFQAEKLFKRYEPSLRASFPSVEFIYIRSGDSIKEIAFQKSKSCSHVIACGGDGTVSKVAAALQNSDTILGVIPLGSGNDFAHSIGLDGSIEQAIQVLRSGVTKCIDTIDTAEGVFINTLGIGIDGATNYYAAKSKFRSGALRYFVGGIRALLTSKPFGAKLIISEDEVDLPKKVWMIALANGKNEGGRYTISPCSDHADGTVEIVVVKPISRIRLMFEFLKLSFGFPFKDDIVDVHTSSNTVRITLETAQYIHADGEQWPLCSSGNFTMKAKSITVLVKQ